MQAMIDAADSHETDAARRRRQVAASDAVADHPRDLSDPSVERDRHKSLRSEVLEREAERERPPAEAEAVAGADEILVADGGEDNVHAARVAEQLAMGEDNVHAARVAEQLAMGDDVPLRPGDHVRVPDGSEAIVVANAHKSAGGYLVKGEMTVADYADVDDTEPVYEVAFEPGEIDDLRDLDDDDVYGYARSILELVRRLGGEE